MHVAIESVVVGERRREDFGDLESLADSISRFGLLHPIVVDDHLNLIAGERRLRACRLLGLTEIEVKSLGELGAHERRQIELEENLRRLDLSPYERSRTLASLAQATREVVERSERREPSMHADEPAASINPTVGQSHKGRPATGGVPLDTVAEHMGVPKSTINRAEQHVAAAERYPQLQAPSVTQRDAIQMAKRLDKMPEPERMTVLEALGTDVLELPPLKRPDEDLAYSAIGKLGAFAHLDPALIAATPSADEAVLMPRIYRQLARWIDRVADELEARSAPKLHLVGGAR